MSLITRGAPTEIQALKAKIYSMEKREQKLQQRIAALEAALIKLRDCDFVITPHDRMDAVREIARQALLPGRGE